MSPGITIDFFGDATGPGYFAQGLWTPTAHKPIVDGCRDLLYWIHERIGQPCSWHHVKAHSGNPWNEAVDTVAKLICDGNLQAPQCEDLWNEVTQNGTQNWTWSWLWFFERIKHESDTNLQFCNTDLLLRLPPHDSDALRSLSFCKFDGVPPQHCQHDDSVGAFVKLKLASINVLTLFAGTDNRIGSGNYISARMEAIAKQCYEQGLDVIGIQETRHKADHYFNLEKFHVLSGAATPKRTGGTQCWISKEAFGLHIETTHLHTRYATDRILIAEIKHPRLHVGVAVLHAPSADGQEDLQEWWQSVDRLLAPLKHLPIFALMDANSRVGSIVSRHIGSHAAVEENDSGDLLHQWLARHSLYGFPRLSATFIRVILQHGTTPQGPQHDWITLLFPCSSKITRPRRGWRKRLTSNYLELTTSQFAWRLSYGDQMRQAFLLANGSKTKKSTSLYKTCVSHGMLMAMSMPRPLNTT